jgi:hypothetical protein
MRHGSDDTEGLILLPHWKVQSCHQDRASDLSQYEVLGIEMFT